MIDISTALQNILKAIYGKDVRQSIHDAIYQINQNANEAVTLAQIRFGTEVTSPTSPIGSYIEKTIYFNIATGIIWKLSGGSWSQIGTMKSIDRIEPTSTEGLIDTYTVFYNDGTTSSYEVTNGERGVSITNVTKTRTTDNIDHYDINLSDGSTTPNGIDVTNGRDGKNGISISNITLASSVGNVKNYNVNLSDGSITPNGFSIADGISNYIHVRYSASFNGQGMVTVPTDQTVYIGIVVTTQSTAPTDPTVYSWVRFIGKAGTGSGDMLKADYSTRYPNVVDRAAALYDGANEISANQLMTKAEYATKGISGTVDKSTQLVDVTNGKVADTTLLANFADEGTELKYKGKGFTKVTDTYSATSGDAMSGKAVASAINGLDVAKVGGTGKYISEISEVDGKISATAVTFPTITKVTDTYSATSGDAMSGKAVASAIGNKANKSTTLSGYGITNAYTKTEVNNKIDSTVKTSTVGSDGKTVSFTGIDTSKCYKPYADVGTSFTDMKPVGMELMTLNGTTLTYVLTNASAGMTIKLREIKL